MSDARQLGLTPGYFSLVLHAHLPFVRHPEHERFFEESWLYEAITETYLPLLQLLEGWQRDGVAARLTLTLSPTLCAMLGDPLLRDRYLRHLENLIALADREILRTRWTGDCHELARMYHELFTGIRQTYLAHGRDLVTAFGRFQEAGLLEIITCSATHAVLPLLDHAPSVRAQILTACDDYRVRFGRKPRGIWLPECAYSPDLDAALHEAGLRWFVLDTHGVLRAKPPPRYGICAPVFTARGLAAFGRDHHTAQQVWSRDTGYPGDPRYRDFYHDIGHELDFNYVQSCLPAPHVRGFTGIKYRRITGTPEKQVYDRAEALRTADGHAAHFLGERMKLFRRLNRLIARPAHLIAPYDAELFGHWWFEGPQFLDFFVRKAVFDQKDFRLATPSEYLADEPTQQVAAPAASSWGEEGHWRVWLNESNAWIYPHLRAAQDRMTNLAHKFPVHGGGLRKRALKQAARELLLAQASDWPFILRNDTHSDYARQRVEQHLANFNRLYDQLLAAQIDPVALEKLETTNNLFPHVNYHYWA
jgi:1,4-alpha-glucan branching enzyme